MVRVIRATWNPLRVIVHSACLTGALAMPAQADLLIPLLFTTPFLLVGALIPTVVVEGLIILARLDIGILLAVAVSAANRRKRGRWIFSPGSACPTRKISARAIRIRYRAGSCSGS